MNRTLFLLGVLLCAGAALAAPSQVQLTDLGGQPITGSNVNVVIDGQKYTVLTGDTSGAYPIDLEVGQKVTFFVTSSETRYLPVHHVVTAEDLQFGINLEITEVLSQHLCDEAIAIDLSSGAASVDGSTVGQTTDPSVENLTCGTLVNTGGVWYTVQGTGNLVEISTCNTADFDTKLSVWCNDCGDLSPDTCIDGNDDGLACAGFTSEVTIPTVAGNEYAILVHGFSGAQGTFTLNVTDLGAAAGLLEDACSAPAPVVATGACCNCLAAPYNCAVTTAEDCAAMTGNFAGLPGIGYQGDDSTCFALGTMMFDYTQAEALLIDGLSELTSTIDVTDSFVIGDLNVGVDIAHTWTGDLTVSIASPSGTSALLVDQPGVPSISACGCPGDDIVVTLDDEGLDGDVEDDLCDLPGGPNPTGGSFAPNNPLGVFDGESATGVWTMTVTDQEPAFDTGTWNSWSLSFTEGAPLCEEAVAPTPGDGDNGECDEDDDELDDESGNGSARTQLKRAVAPATDGLLDLGFSVSEGTVKADRSGARNR